MVGTHKTEPTSQEMKKKMMEQMRQQPLVFRKIFCHRDQLAPDLIPLQKRVCLVRAGRRTAVFSSPVGRNQIEPVIDLRGIHRFMGPWAEWNGITPDGSPILVRDISSHE